ncbi:phenylacetate--CoA ligase family protein [Planctomycetota bacterium]
MSKKNLWDKTPTSIKSTLGRVLEIAPPTWWLGKKYRKNCKFLRDAQWWQAERAREYQLSRLRETLTLAYQKTDFYRCKFDTVGFHPQDFRSLEDIIHLPTIDKDTVIKDITAMCARSVKSPDVDYGSTGGTSGTPLHFYMDSNRSYVEYAYLTTSWERIGYTIGMPMAVIRGRVIRPNRDDFYHEYDPILRHHYYSNFHMTEHNMSRYLRHIRKIGPCVLHTYASSAHTFAKFVLETGEQMPRNVKAILLESENVYADQVNDIERAFGARTFSLYGHSEKLVLAAQCEHSNHYHVWPTYGYFELLDKNGKPVTTRGQQGEIVGTGFINMVMPFIRYRTGDWATYVGDRCEACGREHTIISDIKGRWPQGWLIAADGSVVTMTALNVHDDTLKNVREYQFHQSTPGKATLCIIPNIPLGDQEQELIIANMNKRLQGQVTLNLEIRTKLVKTARGKQSRVIQKCTSST